MRSALPPSISSTLSRFWTCGRGWPSDTHAGRQAGRPVCREASQLCVCARRRPKHHHHAAAQAQLAAWPCGLLRCMGVPNHHPRPAAGCRAGHLSVDRKSIQYLKIAPRHGPAISYPIYAHMQAIVHTPCMSLNKEKADQKTPTPAPCTDAVHAWHMCQRRSQAAERNCHAPCFPGQPRPTNSRVPHPGAPPQFLPGLSRIAWCPRLPAPASHVASNNCVCGGAVGVNHPDCQFPQRHDPARRRLHKGSRWQLAPLQEGRAA